MTKIALIHTVRSVLNSFEELVKECMGEVYITNTLDEFLASDANEKGEFTIDNLNRLFNIIKASELIGASAIVVTCSTLSPAVEMIKPFIKVPLIAVDEAMTRKAVEIGKKITIIASAESTIKPTKTQIMANSRRINREVEINIVHCPEAYDAIRAGNIKIHDEILLKHALEIKQQDVIVLAQASMSHLAEKIEGICGCPVLSSPKLCINQLKECLKENKSC